MSFSHFHPNHDVTHQTRVLVCYPIQMFVYLYGLGNSETTLSFNYLEYFHCKPIFTQLGRIHYGLKCIWGGGGTIHTGQYNCLYCVGLFRQSYLTII